MKAWTALKRRTKPPSQPLESDDNRKNLKEPRWSMPPIGVRRHASRCLDRADDAGVRAGAPLSGRAAAGAGTFLAECGLTMRKDHLGLGTGAAIGGAVPFASMPARRR
jgi:hypothetical protein